MLRRVADQRLVPVRRAEPAPRVDPGSPHLLVCFQRGHHGEVLDRANAALGDVACHPVREQTVPDQQVARLEFGSDHGKLRAVDPRSDGIAVGRLSDLPLVEPAEQLGRALESALFRPGVVERDDPLDPLGQHAERGVDIPMEFDVEPLVRGRDVRAIAILDVGRVEVEPVQGHPQLFAVPHVDERVVDALCLTAVPQELVVVRLHEPVYVQFSVQVRPEPSMIRVPTLRSGRVESLEVPGELQQTGRRGGGDRLLDDDVAVGLPEGEVLLRQHAKRSGLSEIPERCLRQVRLTVRAEVRDVRRGSIQVSVGRGHATTPEFECAGFDRIDRIDRSPRRDGRMAGLPGQSTPRPRPAARAATGCRPGTRVVERRYRTRGFVPASTDVGPEDRGSAFSAGGAPDGPVRDRRAAGRARRIPREGRQPASTSATATPEAVVAP